MLALRRTDDGFRLIFFAIASTLLASRINDRSSSSCLGVHGGLFIFPRFLPG